MRFSTQNIRCCLYVWLCLLPAGLYAQSAWQNYSFQEKQYKVSFPKEADLVMDTIDFEGSFVNTECWQVNEPDSLDTNSFYSLTRSEYPSFYIHSDSAIAVVNDFLDLTQANLMHNNNFTLIAATSIEKEGYPGKDFKWRNNFNHIFFEFQVFLVGNVLYNLSVIAHSAEDANAYMAHFFDSFQLVGVPKGRFRLPDVSSEKSFTIAFPQKPKTDTQVIDSDNGKITVQKQWYEPADKSDNLMFMAAETRYGEAPVALRDSDRLNDFYFKVIESSVNAIGGELTGIKSIVHDGKTGKEYRALLNSGNELLVCRLFFVGNCQYSVGVVTYSDRDGNPKLGQFFDSFHIKQGEGVKYLEWEKR